MVFTQSQVGWDARIIFKMGIASLNAEFSFSVTDWYTKTKKTFYLLFTYSWKEKRWVHAFPGVISAKWNA